MYKKAQILKTAVIMATYNGSKFIEEQLDGIRYQEMPPSYVLIRDDNSSDNTVSLVVQYIEKYNLKNWNISINSKNMGWRLNFRQLMIDVNSLDIDYIFLADQDDIWLPNKIKEQLLVLAERPNIQLLSHDYDNKVSGNGKSIESIYKFPNKNRIEKYPLDISRTHIYRLGWTYAYTSRLNASLIKAYEKIIEPVGHDVIISFAATGLSEAYNLNEKLGIHKLHGNNVSSTGLGMHSPRSEHIQDLLKKIQNVSIAVKVCEEYGSSNLISLKKMLKFYTLRLNNARDRKVFSTIWAVIKYRKFYFNVKDIGRDFLFLLKK